MSEPNSTVMSSSSASQQVFTLDFLKKHLLQIGVSVPSYQTDFMDHTNYKVVFTLEPKQTVFVASKRFNDFVALHEVMKMKLENIELRSFPSKFQVFNRTETRRAYFDEMLKRLLSAAKQHQEIRHKALGMLISFVNLKRRVGKEEVSKDKSEPKTSIFGTEDQSETDRVATVVRDSPVKIEVEVPVQTIKQQIERTVELAEEEQKLIDDGELEYKPGEKIEDRSNVILMKFERDEDWRKKFLRVKGNYLQIYKDIGHNTFETQVELYGITVEYLTKPPTYFDELLIKMEFRDDQPVYPPDYQYLSLYHEHDSQKILLTTPEATSDKGCQALEDLRVRLTKATQQTHAFNQYKGFFSDIGKIYIALYGFKDLKVQGTLPSDKSKDKQKTNWGMVRIKTEAFSYQTKKVQLKEQNTIKQGFIIPVTNVFEQILIQLIQVEDKGWLKQELKQNVLGRYVLRMNDILSYNRGYNFQKVILRLENEETGHSVASMTTTIRNMSQFSSIYAESFASQNDGKYINYEQMSVRQSLNTVECTLDRMLYIFGKIGLFMQSVWRNLYCFKYPRLATSLLIMVALGFVFLDMSNVIVFMTIGLFSVILYNHKSVYPIVEQLLQKFLMGKNHLHRNYINPKILGKSQFKYMKWAHNHIHLKQKTLERTGDVPVGSDVIEKEDASFGKTKKFFFLKKEGNLFKVQDEQQGIFNKFADVKQSMQQIHNTINSMVNVMQKIGSLFTWVDFRRTLYFLVVVLALILITNAMAFRFLGIGLCIHRYIKGQRYYKKHYMRNRKLAEESIKYILNKSFKDIKKELDTRPIEKVTFPIDQEDFKVFKQELESLIPVCINTSEMNDIQNFVKRFTGTDVKTTNKKLGGDKYLPYIEGNRIRLAFFIDLIESCESRLKLERVITKEGRSQEYQDLRNITKEIPVIDIWIEETVKNYVLNTPSLFYDYLHRSSDSVLHRDQDIQAAKVEEQIASGQKELLEPTAS